MSTVIEVVDGETKKVVHAVDCGDKADRMVEKVERGMSINMDPRYFTRIRKNYKFCDCPEQAKAMEGGIHIGCGRLVPKDWGKT